MVEDDLIFQDDDGTEITRERFNEILMLDLMLMGDNFTQSVGLIRQRIAPACVVILTRESPMGIYRDYPEVRHNHD